MDTMAPGCCSAVSPCSHQQRDPSTICDVCKRAAATAERETVYIDAAHRQLISRQEVDDGLSRLKHL